MPVPQPEEVMELASELQEARSRVSQLEARWVAFFTNTNGDGGPDSGVSTQFLKPRIVTFLEERPTLSFNLATIAKGLNAKENSVGPYLSELAKDGKISRSGRGLYASKEHEISDWMKSATPSASTENPAPVDW